ncbi:hypothetical protein COBT_000096 [Conglomerata obtusa]
MANHFLICCDKVFNNDDVESIIDSFFVKENIKVQKNQLTNVDEIMTALKRAQERIERYINICCTQTPINIRDMISETTDKNLPPKFDIATMSVNKFAISVKEQERVIDLVFITYFNMIKKLKKMIIYIMNDLILDVPVLYGHLNETFFNEHIFCRHNDYTGDKLQITNVVKIAAEKTSQSAEFQKKFTNLINESINKKKEFFLFRVRYTFDIFNQNIENFQSKKQNHFKKIACIKDVSNKSLQQRRSDLKNIANKMISDSKYIHSFYEKKTFDDTFIVFKKEIVLYIKKIGTLKAADQVVMTSAIKQNFIKRYRAFYDKFVSYLNDIDQQYHSFDTFILKLGNTKLADIDLSITAMKNVFQSIIQDNTMLLENFVHSIHSDVTTKKVSIEEKHLDGFLKHIHLLLFQSRNNLLSYIEDLQLRIIDYAFPLFYSDVDELFLLNLNISSTEIILKVNTVYDYVHNIWTQKISYYETLVHAYLLMIYVNSKFSLIGKQFTDTFVINMCDISLIKNQIRDNYDYLVQAYEKTGNFFMSLFETNQLNINSCLKRLFSNRLSILMNFYKSRIIRINEISEVKKCLLGIKKQFSYVNNITTSTLTIKAYEFTPHKYALDLYKQSYQVNNENKRIETNYELIIYVNGEDTNGHNLNNENLVPYTKTQDFIIIGLIGTSVIVVFAIIIAILVKRRSNMH